MRVALVFVLISLALAACSSDSPDRLPQPAEVDPPAVIRETIESMRALGSFRVEVADSTGVGPVHTVIDRARNGFRLQHHTVYASGQIAGGTTVVIGDDRYSLPCWGDRCRGWRFYTSELMPDPHDVTVMKYERWPVRALEMLADIDDARIGFRGERPVLYIRGTINHRDVMQQIGEELWAELIGPPQELCEPTRYHTEIVDGVAIERSDPDSIVCETLDNLLDGETFLWSHNLAASGTFEAWIDLADKLLIEALVTLDPASDVWPWLHEEESALRFAYSAFNEAKVRKPTPSQLDPRSLWWLR